MVGIIMFYMMKRSEMTPLDFCLWRGEGPQKRQPKGMPFSYNEELIKKGREIAVSHLSVTATSS